MTRDPSFVGAPRGLAPALGACATLLLLAAVGCGSELKVGRSQVTSSDAGADGALGDPLARAAADMEGNWTNNLVPGLPLTLQFTYGGDRGGTWVLKCGTTPPYECRPDQVPTQSDAGAGFPWDEIRDFLRMPTGDYWVLQFSESSSPIVEGIFASGLGVEFTVDQARKTLTAPPGTIIEFTKVAADAGTRP